MCWVHLYSGTQCLLSFRGYGESDHPIGKDQYKGSYLVNDVKEVVCWNLGWMMMTMTNSDINNCNDNNNVDEDRKVHHPNCQQMSILNGLELWKSYSCP